MTVIAEKDRATVRDLLARELDAPVELLLFTRPRSPLFVPGRPDCQTCAETQELLEELTDLARDTLSLTVHDIAADPAAATRYNVRDVPTVVVRRAQTDDAGAAADTAATPRAEEQSSEPGTLPDDAPGAGEAAANVRFVGLPGGYEFSTLVAGLVDVSKGRSDLSVVTREAVRAIDSEVHLQVFVTPT